LRNDVAAHPQPDAVCPGRAGKCGLISTNGIPAAGAWGLDAYVRVIPLYKISRCGMFVQANRTPKFPEGENQMVDDPIKVDPNHYTVGFENDDVRVIRIR
jgi:hypothetical protein